MAPGGKHTEGSRGIVVIEAIVFDAYGTLFDVASVAKACDKVFPG